MFGFISKRAHDAEIEALTATHDADIRVLADARDHLVNSLNEAEANQRALQGTVNQLRDRVARLDIDNQRLAKEAKDNARFVEVGKARVAAMAKQNERAKAKRAAKVALPDGVFELPGGGLGYTCKGCDRTRTLEVDVTEFDAESAYCGGSPRCLP